MTHDGLARILLAIDFTAATRDALDYAVRTAAQTGARLYLAHALSPGARFDAALGFLDLTEERVRAELTRAAAALGRPTPATVECVRLGRPAPEVAELANEVHADLVVTGTHGRRGIPWLLAGSVAEQIFRSAPCPVVVVRDGVAAAPAPGHTSRALVAVDGSAASLAALGLATRLVPESAEIEAMRVVSGDLFGSAAEATRADLEEAVRETCPSHEPPVRAVVDRGSPGGILSERLAGGGYDLVACGTRNRSGAARALVGSIASALVGAARCPVLIVRDSPR